MPFIDWTDPEEMFGMLVEYVADEESEAHDTARRAFLARLNQKLQALQEVFPDVPLAEAIHALRAIHRSVDNEFETDPVVEHLGACVEELERIHQASA